MGPAQFIKGTSAEQGVYDQAVTQVNQLIEDLDDLVASLNDANGGTITAVPSLAARLRVVAQVVAGNATRSITADSGNNQSGTVGATLTDPLVVEVLDGNGDPVVGEEVTWTPSDESSVIQSSSFTDASGLASVPWRLGLSLGSQTVLASVTGDSVTFSATAAAGAAANLAIDTGNNQTAEVGTELPTDPTVVVTDANGNPKSGVTVTWAVASGAGSRTPATSITNANGVASTNWTLGASAGANTLTATVAGLTGSPQTFSASGTSSAAVPDAIVAQANGAQTGKVAGAAADTITFRVTDGGVAVEGVRVNFTTDLGTLDVDHDFTDSSGDVTVTPTTSTTVAVNTITATVDSDPTLTVTATVTTVAGTATKVLVVQQPPSNWNSGVVLVPQPTFEITDANGNRVLTATNNCTLSKASGSGTMSGTATVAAVAGLITYTNVTITGASSVNVLRATVSGLTTVDTNSITMSPPVPFGVQIQEPISGGLEGQSFTITVQVVDDTNTIIPNATNTVTIAKASGSGTISGTLSRAAVSGVATFTVSIDDADSYTITAASTGLNGDTSGSFTITSAGGAIFTNEPANLTLVLHRPSWESIPPVSPTGSTTDAFGFCVDTNSHQSHLAILNDGGTNVLQVNFLTSQNGGSAPTEVALLNRFDYGTLFVGFEIFVDPTWSNGGNSGTKFGFIRRNGQNNNYINFCDGTSFSGAFRLSTQQTSADQHYSPSGFSLGAANKNRWLRVEILMVANTGGNSDGQFYMWVDGVLKKNLTTGVLHFSSSQTHRWNYLSIEPTYGGGTNHPPTNMYFRIRGMRVSGV